MSKVKTETQNSKSDLKHRSYYLALSVIKFISTLTENTTNRVLCQQLIRSITSVGANIVEAKSASSRKDFIPFYEYALKSSNESKFWVCLLRDSSNGDKENINLILNETEEVSKILASSIITLKKH